MLACMDASVAQYLDEVPDKRAPHVRRLFEEIRSNIDPAFEETMSYNMIGWVLPRSLYPAGYHCTPELPVPFMNLANQKGHIGVYHMGIYADTDHYDWFVTEYAKTGWKLNMGKSCIRFTAMSRIPYELVGQLAGRISASEWKETYSSQDPRGSA